MYFRRLILNAIVAGCLAGVVLSIVQILTVTPIIAAAESFEVSGSASETVVASSATNALTDPAASSSVAIDAGQAETSGHHHSEDAWAPGDGLERLLFTVLSNTLAGIGFSALVLALMNQLQIMGVLRMTSPIGLVWGIAGFVVFFLAPGLGMQPEIPGMQSAPVLTRQFWWLSTVIGVGVGLLVLAYAPVKFKVLGLLGLGIPFVFKAPHLDAPGFTHPDPAVVDTFMALQDKFFMFSGISNLAFWIVIGLACGWAISRWLPDTVKGQSTEPATRVNAV